ncbi:SAF domain-containing protein [Brachybacterium hainanense]|uniref:SAF domain-containing protein n=1 Tax=Brachybacterium hainanense TaxID=1541174 RepID=A0ABV6REM6_9MICO
MLERLRTHAPIWRRALRRRRRVLTALTVAALLAAVLPGMLPPSARGVDVLVAAHALPVGTVLGPADLRRQRVAASLVPEDALVEPASVNGRTLEYDVPAGAAIIAGHLAGPGEAVDVAGRARLVLPVDAALLPQLRRGSQVQIIFALPGAEGPRAVEGQVLAAPSAQEDAARPDQALVPVVVVLDPSQAPDVAQALREGWASTAVIG